MSPWELFWDRSIGWRPLGRPRTQWRDNSPQMAWNHLQIPPIELVEIARVTHETLIWIRAWQDEDVCFCSSLLCLVYLSVNSRVPHIGLVLIIPIHLLIIVAGRATSLLQVTTRALLSFSLLRDRNIYYRPFPTHILHFLPLLLNCTTNKFLAGPEMPKGLRLQRHETQELKSMFYITTWTCAYAWLRMHRCFWCTFSMLRA